MRIRKTANPGPPDQEQEQPTSTRRAVMTGGAVGLAAVAGGAMLRSQPASAQTATPSVYDWINVTNSAYGATGNGTMPDDGAINAALQAAKPGQVVYLPGPGLTPQGGTPIAGIYLLDAPLTIPSGVILAGDVPCGQLATGVGNGIYGSTLLVGPDWKQGGAVLNTAVLIDAGDDGTIYNPVVKDLWISYSTGAPSGVHGIGSNGSVNHMVIDHVGIAIPTGAGIWAQTSNDGGNFPDGWTITNVIVEKPQSDGIRYEGADCYMSNVHAQNGNTSGTGDGFYISGGNNRLIGCRADSCANGFTIEFQVGSAFAGTAVILAGCGTEVNNKNGLNIISNGTPDLPNTVTATGCSFEGDGKATTTGTWAGISVTGPGVIILNACNVFTRGTNPTFYPAYALSFAANSGGAGVQPTLIQALGGFWVGATPQASGTPPINVPTGTVTTLLSYGVHGYAGGKFSVTDTVQTYTSSQL